MFRKIPFLFILFLFVQPTLLLSKTESKKTNSHQVQVKVTFQEANFRTPWRSKNPSTRLSLGIYVGNNQILVPASIITNHTLIEVKSNEEVSAKTAKLIRLDYESDLAILEVKNPGNLFTGLDPVEFKANIITKTNVHIAHLDNSGETEILQGKIENLTMGLYPEARIELPFLELSSSENLRGMGELILRKDNTVVGMLNEFNKSSGKGRVIPSQIIYYFLKEHQSFAYKGFNYRPIIDKTTSTYYGMGKDDSGVLVTETFINSTADKILKPEDIILKIGDFTLDGKGRILHPKYGRISFLYLLQSGQEFGYTIGKSVPVQIIRDKKKLNLTLKLKVFPEEAILIPHGATRDETPAYFSFGGFIFIELSEFYMKEYGRNWRTNVDKKMLYLLDYHKFRKKDLDEKRIVYLMQVLPDDGNTGYHDIRQVRLNKFNGERVDSIEDLHNKFDKVPLTESVTLTLDDGIEIILSRSKIEKIDSRIQKNFQIPNLYQPSTKASKSHVEEVVK